MADAFKKQLVEARRNHIIEAAIEVIAEQGFQRTTIKQIAARAGVADGTIYNYFENKQAILLAIVGRLSAAEVRELHFAEAAQMDFEAFVTAYVAHRAQELAESFPVLKVVLPEMMTDVVLAEAVYEQIYTPAFVVAEQYWEQMMADGQMETADPAIAARLFAAPLLGLMLLHLLGDEHVVANWGAYGEAMSQFMIRAYRMSE